jgi:hypothetical protein
MEIYDLGAAAGGLKRRDFLAGVSLVPVTLGLLARAAWAQGTALPPPTDTTITRLAIYPALGISRVGNSMATSSGIAARPRPPDQQPPAPTPSRRPARRAESGEDGSAEADAADGGPSRGATSRRSRHTFPPAGPFRCNPWVSLEPTSCATTTAM